MEGLITAFGWLAWIALAGLIIVGILLVNFWLFKQYCQILADAVGDKVIEVVEELRENQQAPRT